jgi:hypothetical protein
MPTYAQNNSSLQSQAGSQLRTFDKTVNFNVNAYIYESAGGVNLYPGGTPYSTAFRGATSTQAVGARFEYTGAADSLYNNYLNGNIYTGSRMYSQHVINSITDTMQRTVDQIEGRITSRTINGLLCHNSCHSSCHTSRGRR